MENGIFFVFVDTRRVSAENTLCPGLWRDTGRHVRIFCGTALYRILLWVFFQKKRKKLTFLLAFDRMRIIFRGDVYVFVSTITKPSKELKK